MLKKRTVLIAGIGTSPAVLTETVWALAHQFEPTVPEKIMKYEILELIERSDCFKVNC